MKNMIWVLLGGLVVAAVIWPSEAWEWITTLASLRFLGTYMR